MRSASTKGMKKVNSLNDLLFPVVIVNHSDVVNEEKQRMAAIASVLGNSENEKVQAMAKQLSNLTEQMPDTECNSEYQFDIYVYPYTKIVEVGQEPENQAIDQKAPLALNPAEIGEVVEPEALAVIEPENVEVETIQGTENELIKIVDYSKKLRVNSCSSRYELIPNSKIFPAIEQVLMVNGIKYRAVYKMINHARFYVEYIITDERFAFKVGNGDIVQPVIKVQHSYNGLTKYSITVGYFRLVCINGLVIAIEDMKEFNLNIVGKHTANIKKSLNRLENALNMFKENSAVLQIIGSKYKTLNSAKVVNNDLKQAIQMTLEKSGIALNESKNLNTVDNVYLRITKELNEHKELNFNGTYTNWHVYNGINSYIYDNSENIATPEIRVTSDQNVFELLLKNSREILKDA